MRRLKTPLLKLPYDYDYDCDDDDDNDDDDNDDDDDDDDYYYYKDDSAKCQQGEIDCTERFHMTSRQPYWCSKTMKRLPRWCSKPVLCERNLLHMLKLSLVPINLYSCGSLNLTSFKPL